MTSPTTPSGTVSCSGVYDSETYLYDAWEAFDDSLPSMWISEVGQAPAWISYEWSDGPRTIQRYAIDFVNGTLTTRAPKDWILEGWNGGAWIAVDTQNNQTNWLGHDRREYVVASPGPYSKYRLYITNDNDDTNDTPAGPGIAVVSMGRLELLGCP
jgi:hypothetical protein